MDDVYRIPTELIDSQFIFLRSESGSILACSVVSGGRTGWVLKLPADTYRIPMATLHYNDLPEEAKMNLFEWILKGNDE